MTEEKKPLLEGGKSGEFKTLEKVATAAITVGGFVATAAYSEFNSAPSATGEDGSGFLPWLIWLGIVASSSVTLWLKNLSTKIKR